jgi:hypothetical protein
LILRKENPYDGHYPIHIAVRNLAVQNIKILLEADPDCANQTLHFDKTPLHLITEVLDDTNLHKAFEIVQIFSKFNGNFSWPARKSGNQTPFSMILERLATLQDKETCLQLIRYLISKYPKIDMFQRKKCAAIIRQHFQEIVDKYQVIENWKEEAGDEDWKLELEKLILENETEFLVKFDVQKKSMDLKDYLSEGVLLHLSIEHDKFESFVEIYGIIYKNFNITLVIEIVLRFNRCRMLKYILNHQSVPHIDPALMLCTLMQMKDKETDLKLNNQRCFHILLDHPNYYVNEQIPEHKNKTALRIACSMSEYAIVELLKSGASLGTHNDGLMAIQFIDDRALKKFFDSCITVCIPEELTGIHYSMVIDYSFLKADKEMSLIEYMTEAKDVQPLIEHPVIASFLFLKWLRLSNIFFLNLLLFSVTAVSFSIYLIFVYVNQDHLDSKNYGWIQIWQILAYIAFIIFSAKEIIQLIGSPRFYFKSAENYFEICVLLLMAVTLFTNFKDQQVHRSIAAVLIMGFAIEWTMIFSALPIFSVSNYIVMLKKVAINFLRTMAFYSIILLAFALSFYILIDESEGNTGNFTTSRCNETVESKKSKNLSIFQTLFHVILMLTGDYGDITDEVTDIMIGRIFLVVFVLSMSIVMMNLLVGLTVSDTATIGKEAEWYKWWERAKLLRKYESMLWNW